MNSHHSQVTFSLSAIACGWLVMACMIIPFCGTALAQVPTLTYTTPQTSVVGGTTVGATLSSSSGYLVWLQYGDDTAFSNGGFLAFTPNNSGGPQTFTHTFAAANPAKPIYYRFVYRSQFLPPPPPATRPDDVVGPTQVVQPAGLVPYLRSDYSSAATGALPSGWSGVPATTVAMAGGSLTFFDALDRGKMDLLATGIASVGTVDTTTLLLYNSNPYHSGDPFFNYTTPTVSAGAYGQRWAGFGEVLSFDNRNIPGFAIGGDCLTPFYQIVGGSSYGLILGLPFRFPTTGEVKSFEFHGTTTSTPEFEAGQGSFNPLVFKQLSTGFQLGDIIAGPGRAAVADYDQDGFDDVLIMSANGGLGKGRNYVGQYTMRTFLLRNVANTGLTTQQYNLAITPRVFMSVPTSLPVPAPDELAYSNLLNGSLATGDVNRDGYPDVFVALRESDGVYRARVFLNQNGLDFVPGPSLIPPGSTRYGISGADMGTNQSDAVLPSCALADFNGDGHLDVLIAGWGDFSDPKTAIYHGDGTGQFTDSGISLPQRGYASVAVGDFFNNGRNSILLSGRLPSSGALGAVANPMVLRNDGGSFTAMDWAMMPARSHTGRSIALADFNNDGRLDVATSDQAQSQQVSGAGNFIGYPLVFYTNTLDIPANQPPAAPGSLVSTVSAGGVTLTWGAATDDITPPALLTYNLRVGTTPGGTDRVTPLANLTTGWRKVVAPGNRGHMFTATLQLAPGTYYWSVQAVDGAYTGGAWATEQSFTVSERGLPGLAIAADPAQLKLSWPWWAGDWTLQKSPDLSAGSWMDITSTPYLRLGGYEWSETMEPATTKLFFRLKTQTP